MAKQADLAASKYPQNTVFIWPSESQRRVNYWAKDCQQSKSYTIHWLQAWDSEAEEVIWELQMGSPRKGHSLQMKHESILNLKQGLHSCTLGLMKSNKLWEFTLSIQSCTEFTQRSLCMVHSESFCLSTTCIRTLKHEAATVRSLALHKNASMNPGSTDKNLQWRLETVLWKISFNS